MLKRTAIVLLAATGIAGQAAVAAPPTEDTWWSTMGQYIGDHTLFDGTGTTELGEFQVEWGVPFERLNYRFQSVGDGPASTMTGFAHWDEKTKGVRLPNAEGLQSYTWSPL